MVLILLLVFHVQSMIFPPNTSLEPTGVGAGSYSLRISGWRKSPVAGGSVLGR
jgi:hypothetical protein